MMDMSKAFDTVRRELRMQGLEEIVDDDELLMAKILVKDVNLVVICGQEKESLCHTDRHTPRGLPDCHPFHPLPG